VVLPLVGTVFVSEVGLPLVTVMLGLLDGFNPCAMWVLLFLLSLLVNLESRRLIVLIAGTFVAVSGLVYFLFMAAWLNLFLLIGYTRWIQLSVGALALVMGALYLKEGLFPGGRWRLGIPEARKPGLYARVRRVIQANRLLPALAAVTVLAFAVNTLELFCTAGLPALYTGILSSREMSLPAYYGYLLLYNLAYLADDALMVTLVVVTLRRYKLQPRQGRILKLLSGALVTVLGLLLIFRPEWLL
jgi:hypothetical protein